MTPGRAGPDCPADEKSQMEQVGATLQEVHR